MSLEKIKTPVEYSFLQWINSHPDSSHWKDKERFFVFVRTVCRHNAKKWKNVQYLKRKILQYFPHFDSERLQKVLETHHNLIEFYKIKPVTSDLTISGRDVKDGNYIEIYVKGKDIFYREIPLDNSLTIHKNFMHSD